MSLRLDCLAIDAHDPLALGRWWAELLGGETEVDGDGDVVVHRAGVDLLFLGVDDDKVVKNRLHLDLRPDDQAAEVARAEALGATHTDVGQGEQTWVVLADPEGNEFCILRAEDPGGPAAT